MDSVVAPEEDRAADLERQVLGLVDRAVALEDQEGQAGSVRGCSSPQPY